MEENREYRKANGARKCGAAMNLEGVAKNILVLLPAQTNARAVHMQQLTFNVDEGPESLGY